MAELEETAAVAIAAMRDLGVACAEYAKTQGCRCEPHISFQFPCVAHSADRYVALATHDDACPLVQVNDRRN